MIFLFRPNLDDCHADRFVVLDQHSKNGGIRTSRVSDTLWISDSKSTQLMEKDRWVLAGSVRSREAVFKEATGFLRAKIYYEIRTCC